MLRVNNNIKPAQIVSKLRNAHFNVPEEDMPTREQVSGYKSRQMASVRGASNTTEPVRNVLNELPEDPEEVNQPFVFGLDTVDGWIERLPPGTPEDPLAFLVSSLKLIQLLKTAKDSTIFPVVLHLDGSYRVRLYKFINMFDVLF